jgi:N-acyl-D-aspartate/D-glutamate deacylase
MAEFDILIKNATIVDGTGKKGTRARWASRGIKLLP